MKTKLMVAMLMMATMTTTAMAQQQGRGKSVELKKAQVEQFQRRDLSKKDMIMRQQMIHKDQIKRQKMAGDRAAMQIKDQKGFITMQKKPVMSEAMRRKLFIKQLRQKKLMCKHCSKDFHHMHHHHHHA